MGDATDKLNLARVSIKPHVRKINGKLVKVKGHKRLLDLPNTKPSADFDKFDIQRDDAFTWETKKGIKGVSNDYLIGGPEFNDEVVFRVQKESTGTYRWELDVPDYDDPHADFTTVTGDGGHKTKEAAAIAAQRYWAEDTGIPPGPTQIDGETLDLFKIVPGEYEHMSEEHIQAIYDSAKKSDELLAKMRKAKEKKAKTTKADLDKMELRRPKELREQEIAIQRGNTFAIKPPKPRRTDSKYLNKRYKELGVKPPDAAQRAINRSLKAPEYMPKGVADWEFHEEPNPNWNRKGYKTDPLAGKRSDFDKAEIAFKEDRTGNYEATINGRRLAVKRREYGLFYEVLSLDEMTPFGGRNISATSKSVGVADSREEAFQIARTYAKNHPLKK